MEVLKNLDNEGDRGERGDAWWNERYNHLMERIPASVRAHLKARISNTRIRGRKFELDEISDAFAMFLEDQVESYERKKECLAINNKIVRDRMDGLHATIRDLKKKLESCKALIQKQHKLIESYRERTDSKDHRYRRR